MRERCKMILGFAQGCAKDEYNDHSTEKRPCSKDAFRYQMMGLIVHQCTMQIHLEDGCAVHRGTRVWRYRKRINRTAVQQTLTQIDLLHLHKGSDIYFLFHNAVSFKWRISVLRYYGISTFI